MANIEDAQARVRNAFNDMMAAIDKDIIRQRQADMHTCAAKCYGDRKSPIEDIERCAQNCNAKLMEASNFVQREVEGFQNRITRCAMDCQDAARDKLGPDTKESEIQGYKEDMERCVIKCVDTHITTLPSLEKRLRLGLTKGKYD
ncbi:protein FAM136A-like [Saccostrea echinata]|uniref:protein FAM136A-like n=1 Tax=Saccostrea echinata TaxID=191078 RepID=UPI002A803D00|nr:protein FAM136A-like [Saccostrea echinata]